MRGLARGNDGSVNAGDLLRVLSLTKPVVIMQSCNWDRLVATVHLFNALIRFYPIPDCHGRHGILTLLGWPCNLQLAAIGA